MGAGLRRGVKRAVRRAVEQQARAAGGCAIPAGDACRPTMMSEAAVPFQKPGSPNSAYTWRATAGEGGGRRSRGCSGVEGVARHSSWLKSTALS